MNNITKIVKRIDDLAIIEELIDKAGIIIIVPKRNELLVFSKEHIESDRVTEIKTLKNHMFLYRIKLSL